MIPSPVNLSTVPSKRWTPSERIAKKRCMILRHSSGSSCSARSIEPFTSANSTVTCLRSASSLASLSRSQLTPTDWLRAAADVAWSRACARPWSPELRPASAGRPRCASTPPAGGSSPACASEEDAEVAARGRLRAPRAADARRHRRRADRRRRGADRAPSGGDGWTGLVNNAGVAIPGPLETMPMEDFRRQVEVNLIAHVAVTQAMLPAIRRAPGRIVFISLDRRPHRLPAERRLPRRQVRDRGRR